MRNGASRKTVCLMAMVKSVAIASVKGIAVTLCV